MTTHVRTRSHSPYSKRDRSVSLRPVIFVESYDEKGDNLRRTYYTVIDGREVLLAPCANPYGDGALREVRAKVRELFGADAVVELAESAR